jgi:RNA polymerase sigma factor (sigma-70 family)
MGDVHHGSVRSSVRILFEDGTATGLTDAQLVEQFVAQRDEAAFTALVERHGPMVQRVCHDVLGHHHDAQDAFQATFLVLARRAGLVRRRDSVASWLYGVALRVAAGARSASARRRVHEHNRAAQRMAETDSSENALADDQEIAALVHTEIGRLPERFRAAVVLCYLEGRTYEEAARVLRCPVGTIKSRLATARERLRRRLEHLAPVTAASSARLMFEANPLIGSMPMPISAFTFQAVIRHASGGAAPFSISQLTQGALKNMLWCRLMGRVGLAGALLACAVVLATGAIALARMKNEFDADDEHEAIPAAVSAEEPHLAPLEEQSTERKPLVQFVQPITLTGRILDERGVPVPNAEVRFRLFRSKIPTLRIASELVDLWETKTDADGRYRIANVLGIEGSEYHHLAMDVNAPGFVEFIEFYFAGFGQIAKAKGLVSDVRLERGDFVTGRCIGPDGKPEPAAKIRSAFAGRPVSSLGRARATDADGRFRLAIPHGVSAELIVYPERHGPPPGPIPSAHVQQLVPRRIRVAAGAGDLGEIRLDAGEEHSWMYPVLHLTAEQAGSSYARVPGGHFLKGQVIAFESVDRGEFGWFPITLVGKTDRDGTFEGMFRAPPLKGPFKVWATQAHESGLDDRGPIVSRTPLFSFMPQVVEFHPHSARGLNTGAYRPVAIRGTITGPDGKPASGVSLMLLAAIGNAQEKRLTTLQWTTTNAEGQFALNGIPQGLSRASLNVHAQPPDRRSHFEAIASGNFQGTAAISSVSFDPLMRDQDPLNFRLNLVTLEAPAPPKINPVEEKAKAPRRYQGMTTQSEKREAEDELARALFQMAEIAPGSDEAEKDLIQIITELRLCALGDRATEMLIRDHIRSPNITPVFNESQTRVVGSIATERLFREALAKNRNGRIQGLACFHLARYLDYKASLIRHGAISDPAQPEHPGVTIGEENGPLGARGQIGDADPRPIELEAVRYYEQTMRAFGDLPLPQPLDEHPEGRSLLARLTTLGAAADFYRRELKDLGIGQPAPEIEGTDLDGRPMRLSDYRGKVVAIYFCGPVQLSTEATGQPAVITERVRSLAMRHASDSFALLGVSTLNPGRVTERESFKKSLKDSRLPARFWWDITSDGKPGPIQTGWHGRIDLYVLDHRGMIRFKHGFQPEILEKAITTLLKEKKDELGRPK